MEWSETRNPESANCIEYATTPKVSLPEWTKAYQWAAVEKRTVIQETAGTFFTASSTSTQITKKRLKQYKEAKWRTFDEFIQLNNGVWKIFINNDVSDSICTCPSYLKKLVCKHVLGMLIRLKKVDVPSAAKSVPFGQKRKRGRPAQAKRGRSSYNTK